MKQIFDAGMVFAFLVAAPAAAAPPSHAETEGGNLVYVSQVGSDNRATIVQQAATASANLEQDGTGNDAAISQSASGSAIAKAIQSGTGNLARLDQAGSGDAVAYLVQSGDQNSALVNQQTIGALGNEARITQTGNGNSAALDQEGSDNLASLTQAGDGNALSATQVGAGNRLDWTQQGDHLTDLHIIQTGGAQQGGILTIIQTNGGVSH